PESRQVRWRQSSSELLIGIQALEYRTLARRTVPGTVLGQPHQRLFHRGQRADLFLHVGNFRFRDRPHFASIALVIDAEGQQLPDLRQGKAELLSALDEAHAPYGGLGVDSIAGRQARRLREKALPFVITDGLQVHPAPVRYLSDLHSHGFSDSSINL